jgi:hypothetical protein
MMTLMEEMRVAVLQIWQSLGFERSSRTAAAVIPALVLGITLNVAALGVVDKVLTGGHATCQRSGLRSVARSEVMMVRAAVASTLKKICEQQPELCSVRQWMLDRQDDAMRYRSETSYGWSARVSSKGVAISIVLVLPEKPDRCRRSVQDLA